MSFLSYRLLPERIITETGRKQNFIFFLSNNREKGFVLIDNEDIDLDDHSAERCISLLLFFIPSFFRKMQPPFPLSRHPSRKNTTFYDVTWESGRLKTTNIKPWKPMVRSIPLLKRGGFERSNYDDVPGNVQLAGNCIYFLNSFCWQSFCEQSCHTDNKLHKKTYKNFCYGKIKVPNNLSKLPAQVNLKWFIFTGEHLKTFSWNRYFAKLQKEKSW